MLILYTYLCITIMLAMFGMKYSDVTRGDGEGVTNLLLDCFYYFNSFYIFISMSYH